MWWNTGTEHNYIGYVMYWTQHYIYYLGICVWSGVWVGSLLQQVCLRHHLDPERSPSVHGVADGGRYHGELVWSTQV